MKKESDPTSDHGRQLATNDEIRRLNEDLEIRIQRHTADLETALAQLQRDRDLLAAVRRSQARFIAAEDPSGRDVFEGLLGDLLALTGSEYGFIDQLLRTPEGKPYLTARAITNIAWNDETRAMYPRFLAGELTFERLDSLFGAVITTGRTVVANDAPHDPRRGGIPPGHPPLRQFLGLPLLREGTLLGVIGLANAPGGYDEALIARLQPMVDVIGLILSAWCGEQARRSAEAELRRANRELEAASIELGTFSSSFSHNLRTPLRAIDGFARILLEEHARELSSEATHLLGSIRSSSQEMGRLIDDFLQFSQLSRRPLASTDVDILAMVQNVMTEVTREDPGRRVELVTSALPGCRADASLVRMLLRNLLSNAFKFTRIREVCRIEVGYRSGEYFVSDNGVGFDMRYVGKLFHPFERLHRAEDYAGTGMGLAIVDRIVRRHGGRVRIESTPDRGTTVHFTLGPSILPPSERSSLSPG